MKKTVVGLVETVEINGKKFKARIDTGAQTGSIDAGVASRLGLRHITRYTEVISASGMSYRKVVKAVVKIKNRKIRASFTVADRSNLSFKVLIGRNILRKNFLVDCKK